MKIKLITVANKAPAWVNEGYHTYSKRLSGDCQLELCELQLPKRHKHQQGDKLKQLEAELIISALPKRHHMIACDEHGQTWDTLQLSQQLKTWQQTGLTICMLIGGPDGLHPSLIQQAAQTWSLSRLTFPHPLVRIIIAEQLYRAHSILQGHPYHRV